MLRVFCPDCFIYAVVQPGFWGGSKKRSGWFVEMQGVFGELIAKLWLFLLLNIGMIDWQYLIEWIVKGVIFVCVWTLDSTWRFWWQGLQTMLITGKDVRLHRSGIVTCNVLARPILVRFVGCCECESWCARLGFGFAFGCLTNDAQLRWGQGFLFSSPFYFRLGRSLVEWPAKRMPRTPSWKIQEGRREERWLEWAC